MSVRKCCDSGRCSLFGSIYKGKHIQAFPVVLTFYCVYFHLKGFLLYFHFDFLAAQEKVPRLARMM